MRGYNSAYVPGWDCHGLPIEWKIEEQYRAKGKDKDEVPINEFRHECRAFAQYWIKVQREEFKRLGVVGDFDNPYLTMNFHAEGPHRRRTAEDRRERPALPRLEAGHVVGGRTHRARRGRGRVRTTIESDTIWVKFPVCRPNGHGLGLADGSRARRLVVIWTDHALDHPRQPRDRLFAAQDRLRPLRGHGAPRTTLGRGRARSTDLRRQACRRSHACQGEAAVL